MILVMCRGFVDIIKIMHDSGADVTSKKLGGATPLFIAAQKGKVEAVRVLIELGAEVGYFFIINYLGGVILPLFANIFLGQCMYRRRCITGRSCCTKWS